MTKKFRLKPKTAKPVRKLNVSRAEDIRDCSGASLLLSLQEIANRGIDLENVTVEAETEDTYGGSYEILAHLVWKEDESKEAFAGRRAVYKKRMADYLKWTEDFKVQIAQIREQDDAEKREKEQSRVDREIAIAEVRLKKLKRMKGKGL